MFFQVESTSKCKGFSLLLHRGSIPNTLDLVRLPQSIKRLTLALASPLLIPQGILHPCLYMYLSHMYLRPTLARIFPAIDPPAMMRLWSEPVSYTTVKRAMIKDAALLALVVVLLLVAVLGVALCPEMFKWWEMVTAGLVAGYAMLMGSGMSE